MSNNELSTCGCSDSSTSRTNPPGQSTVSYRVGTWSTFLASMKGALATQTLPDGDFEGTQPLAALTTRASDDPTIALFDAFACALDVLTFYQERIANETWLRTATEERSVQYLARMVGYERNPGVAASVWLAWTVEDAEGAPGVGTVPAGTQVMSMPAGEGLPQTFETSEELVVDKALNEILPKRTTTFTLSGIDALRGLFDPDTGVLSAGARRTLVFSGLGLKLNVGDRILLHVGGIDLSPVAETDYFTTTLTAVEEDVTADWTLVTLADVLPSAPVAPTPPTGAGEALMERNDDDTYDELKSGVRVHVFRSVMPPFGWNAPDRFQMSASVVAAMLDSTVWGWDDHRCVFCDDYIHSPTTLGGRLVRPVAALGSTTVTLPAAQVNSVPHLLVLAGENTKIEDDSWMFVVGTGWTMEQDEGASETDPFHYDVSADATQSEFLYRVGSTSTGKRGVHTISGPATTVRAKIDAELRHCPPFHNRRELVAYVQSEALSLADLPRTTNITQASPRVWLSGDLRTVLPVGRRLMFSDGSQSELVFVKSVGDYDEETDLTQVTLEDVLVNEFDPLNTVVYGNVVQATHGETVSEILGSGDGATPNQTFTLVQGPLTFVPSSDSPTGGASTLSVAVNNGTWSEVTSFYEQTSSAQVYTLRLNDAGRTEVAFGDGVVGARLPTGSSNVAVSYRKGLGAAGNVGAGSLTLMKTRPYGLRGVTNPFEASGGDEPEDVEDLRTNAPLQVVTLDRLVSLTDYEDFAMAFAGVGKAKAERVRVGGRPAVVLSVFGDDGASMDTSNLEAAIVTYGDPLTRVVVVNGDIDTFSLVLSVLVAEGTDRSAAETDITSALIAAFGFDQRNVGQRVYLSEVVEVVHGVGSVLGVRDVAMRLPETSTDVTSVRARGAREVGGTVLGAELVLLNAAWLTGATINITIREVRS